MIEQVSFQYLAILLIQVCGKCVRVRLFIIYLKAKQGFRQIGSNFLICSNSLLSTPIIVLKRPIIDI